MMETFGAHVVVIISGALVGSVALAFLEWLIEKDDG